MIRYRGLTLGQGPGNTHVDITADARTGPFLAAVAFFMTGGVTALSNESIRAAKFVLPDGVLLPLPLIALTLSVILAGLSAMSLVLSLGPPVPPQTKSDEPATVRSHNFYKYERIVEGRALLLLSLPFFFFGILTTLFVLDKKDSNAALDFSWPLTLGGAAIVFVVTFAACNDRARIESLGSGAEGDARVFSKLAVSLSIAAGLTFAVCGVGGLLLPAVLLTVAAGAAGWSGWVLRARRNDPSRAKQAKRALDSLPPLLVPGFQLVVLVVGLVPALRPCLMLCALYPVGIFEGSRLLYGYAGLTARDYWRNNPPVVR
ncbi:hypothetical protein ACQP2X_28880 [Actinoplanes sp. CA-131856]